MPRIDEIRNDDNADFNNIIVEIPLEDIIVEKQIREEFDEEYINNLANDIEKNGLIQPVIVYKKDEKYCLWIGENRFRAYKKLYEKEGKSGFRTIKAMIKDKPVNAVKKKILQLCENIQRKDLTQEEIRNTLNFLKTEGEMSHEAIANVINKTHQYVSVVLGALKTIEQFEAWDLNYKDFSESNSVLNDAKNLSLEELKELIKLKKKDSVSRTEIKAKKTNIEHANGLQRDKKEVMSNYIYDKEECRMFLKKHFDLILDTIANEKDYSPSIIKLENEEVYKHFEKILESLSKTLKSLKTKKGEK